mgnify:CR=1 FL=1
MSKDNMTQKRVDNFYKQNGKCCAGCDHWGWITAMIGECGKSPLVSASERISLLNIEGLSLDVGAGKIMTERDYCCGNFIDTYDWEEKS